MREVEPERADDPEVTKFYTSPIAKPLPQGQASQSLQDTISELNAHKPGAAGRNGLEVSFHGDRKEEMDRKSPWRRQIMHLE